MPTQELDNSLKKINEIVGDAMFQSIKTHLDELVKLNGVDPALRFRDIKDLHAFMSKALSINLTVKRPFSNEGKVIHDWIVK